jgi:hypothetical protein
MYKSPLNYTSIMLQLDNPLPSDSSGAAANYSAYVSMMTDIVASIPLKYRVGFHAVVESDATWQFAPALYDTHLQGPKTPALVTACAGVPASASTTLVDTAGSSGKCFVLQFAAGKPFSSMFIETDWGKAHPDECSRAIYDPSGKFVIGPGAGNIAVTDIAESQWPPGKCWEASYIESLGSTIISSTPLPSNLVITPGTIFYGANTNPTEAITSSHLSTLTQDGYPFQVQPQLTGEQACPYKATATKVINPDGSSSTVISFPDGCPGNMSRLGWYVCLINAMLRQKGSAQRISAINYDAEGNGPASLQCSLFQFLYAVRQFGSVDDIIPLVNGKRRMPWIVYQNGATGLSIDALNYRIGQQPCGYFQLTNINLGAAADAPAPGTPDPYIPGATYPAVSTYGDMLNYQAAPEFYWGEGQDMGGVADGKSVTRDGFLPSLVEAGYVGCPQSGFQKPKYDDKCGCRQTVYETYSHVDDGPLDLLDILCPWHAMYAKNIPGETPAFSIEHLGPAGDFLKVDLCMNSQNFCAAQNGPACLQDQSCQPRCGVANFLGHMTEQCFKQFLDAFAARYGAKSLMVYDAGFLPEAWIDGITYPAVSSSGYLTGEQAEVSVQPMWPASDPSCKGQGSESVSELVANYAALGITVPVTNGVVGMCPLGATPAPPPVNFMCGPSTTTPTQPLTPAATQAGFAGYPNAGDVPCWSCTAASPSGDNPASCVFMANNIADDSAFFTTSANCLAACGATPAPPPPGTTMYMCGPSSATPVQPLTAAAQKAGFKGYATQSDVPCWSCTDASTGTCTFMANNIANDSNFATTSALCAQQCKQQPPPPPATTLYNCGASSTGPPTQISTGKGVSDPSQLRCWSCHTNDNTCAFHPLGNGLDDSYFLTADDCMSQCKAPLWACGASSTAPPVQAPPTATAGAASAAETLCWSCGTKGDCVWVGGDGTAGTLTQAQCSTSCAVPYISGVCAPKWDTKSNAQCAAIKSSDPYGYATAFMDYCSAHPTDSACAEAGGGSGDASGGSGSTQANIGKHASKGGKLSGGAIAGIVVGIVVVVAAIATGAAIAAKKAKRRR